MLKQLRNDVFLNSFLSKIPSIQSQIKTAKISDISNIWLSILKAYPQLVFDDPLCDSIFESLTLYLKRK